MTLAAFLSLPMQHVQGGGMVPLRDEPRLESGRRDTVTTDVAKRLARALGVGIDYLVGTRDNGDEEVMPDESDLGASMLFPTETREHMAL
jgi:hypothetical protein